MSIVLLAGMVVAMGCSSISLAVLVAANNSGFFATTAAPLATSAPSAIATNAGVNTVKTAAPPPNANGWYGVQEPVGIGGGKWTCENRTNDGVTTVAASADGCVPVGGKCPVDGGTYAIPALGGKCPVGVVPPDPTMYQIPDRAGACFELVDVPNQEYGKVVRTNGIRVFSGDPSKNNTAQKLSCPPRNGKCFNFAGDPVMPSFTGACPTRGVVYNPQKAVAYVAKKNADSGRKTKSQIAAGV